MRAVVHRVAEASVRIDGVVSGRIGPGLAVLLGVAVGDGERDADYLAEKVLNLRVFPDDAGQMNRSVLDTGGAVLVVSQFTLYGDMRKGRRPSFDDAAPPELARALYEGVVRELRSAQVPVATGQFQAMMRVELVNDGPVTVLVDSTKQF